LEKLQDNLDKYFYWQFNLWTKKIPTFQENHFGFSLKDGLWMFTYIGGVLDKKRLGFSPMTFNRWIV